MTYAAGALSKSLVGSSTAVLSSAVATGGTGPYTYQWYRSTTTGFSPGAGTLISGAVALALNDSGLQPGTTYFYVVVATDTGAGSATANSAQLTVVMEVGQNQNQFAMNQIVGLVDMRVGPTNVISAQVDASVGSAAAPLNVINPGQGVKVVASTAGGILKVAPVAAKNDACIGFAVYNIKDIQYAPGNNLEVALWGSVIWCMATAAITQFAQVGLDVTYIGGVQPTGNTSTLMGWAFDGCAAAGPIRVMLLQNASFATV